MIAYLLRRLANYVLMIFVSTTIAYFAAVVFLKPQYVLSQVTPRPTPAQVDARLVAAGLDPHASPVTRYVEWVTGVLHGNWGMSPFGTSVNDEFFTRALVSGRLVIIATILMIVVGVALGVYTASRQYKLGDRFVTNLSYFISCVPSPVVYLMVQMAAIAANQRSGSTLFYVSGIKSVPEPEGAWPQIVDQAQHLILPTIALTIVGYTGYQLLQRSMLLDNINADYVRTARAKGLTKSKAIRRHALRTSFIPVAQSIAFSIPAVFAGTFIIEAVFAWQGLGRYTIEAITTTADVNATVASIAFGGFLFAIGAILADLSVAIVDPRVRVS